MPLWLKGDATPTTQPPPMKGIERQKSMQFEEATIARVMQWSGCTSETRAREASSNNLRPTCRCRNEVHQGGQVHYLVYAVLSRPFLFAKLFGSNPSLYDNNARAGFAWRAWGFWCSYWILNCRSQWWCQLYRLIRKWSWIFNSNWYVPLSYFNDITHLSEVLQILLKWFLCNSHNHWIAC